MKDRRGLYYYPYPQNPKVRMYVRRDRNEICFRLWNGDDPALWIDHGWVPYGAIRQAASMYQGKGLDPDVAYDIRAAEALLREDEIETS